MDHTDNPVDNALNNPGPPPTPAESTRKLTEETRAAADQSLEATRPYCPACKTGDRVADPNDWQVCRTCAESAGAPRALSKNRSLEASMLACQADIEAVAKTRHEGAAVPYAYRGVDDIVNACQPWMNVHGIGCLPDTVELIERTQRPTRSGGNAWCVVIRVIWRWYDAFGGSLLTQTLGESQDSADKALSQAFSVAQRENLVKTFCIPTEAPFEGQRTEPLEGIEFNALLEKVKAARSVKALVSLWAEYVESYADRWDEQQYTDLHQTFGKRRRDLEAAKTD